MRSGWKYKLYRGCLFVAVTMVFSLTCPAQEKPKEQRESGTTVDAWRNAIPDVENRSSASEIEAADTRVRTSVAEIEKTLFDLEHRWMTAIKLRDAAQLEQVVTDDFVFVSPRLTGSVRDRNQYFAHSLRDLSLLSFSLENLKVRLYGRTALVSGSLTMNAAVAGDDWSGTYVITDVWINREGFWRAVSRHASLVPSSKTSR